MARSDASFRIGEREHGSRCPLSLRLLIAMHGPLNTMCGAGDKGATTWRARERRFLFVREREGQTPPRCEGFEVVVGGLNFFAFSNFTLKINTSNPHRAKYNTSHCGDTMVGWYQNLDRTKFGCYYGTKVLKADVVATCLTAFADCTRFPRGHGRGAFPDTFWNLHLAFPWALAWRCPRHNIEHIVEHIHVPRI